jgi:hypothetical protein
MYSHLNAWNETVKDQKVLDDLREFNIDVYRIGSGITRCVPL